MKLHQRRRVASARLKHQGKEPLSNLGTNPPHSPSAVAVALPSAQVSSLGMFFWTSSASPPSALHHQVQLLLSLISCLLQLGLHHCLCSQSLWSYMYRCTSPVSGSFLNSGAFLGGPWAISLRASFCCSPSSFSTSSQSRRRYCCSLPCPHLSTRLLWHIFVLSLLGSGPRHFSCKFPYQVPLLKC